MGDEFDACECVWSHEIAMARLLAFIRQNQQECTNTECFDVTGRLNPGPLDRLSSSGDESSFMMTAVFMILALLMYFVRPERIMRSFSSEKKSRDSDSRRDDDDDDFRAGPRPTPPAIN